MLISTVIPARDLTPVDLAAWSRIQGADPALHSPFLCPEFTMAVAEVRDDVEVAILKDGTNTVGFFPFQRGKWKIGGPVGGGMSTRQALIVERNIDWNASEIVSSCGLRAWRFDVVAETQAPLAPFHRTTEKHLYIDLSAGYDAWKAARRKAGSSRIPETERRARKLEREVAPVRFDWDSNDTNAIQTLLKWKHAQFERTNVTDVFAFDWTRDLIQRLQAVSGNDFSMKLSVLYAGDRRISVALGLRYRDILHGWFTSYDTQYMKYSPGNIMLVNIVRNAAEHRLARLEMGSEKTAYKASFATNSTLMAAGSVTCSPFGHFVCDSLPRACDWIRNSPLRSPARIVGRWTRQARGAQAFK